jgi:hypothetical protein
MFGVNTPSNSHHSPAELQHCVSVVSLVLTGTSDYFSNPTAEFEPHQKSLSFLPKVNFSGKFSFSVSRS